MKKIPLSQHGKNRDKFVALVDDEDYDRLRKFIWHILKGRNTIYAMRKISFCGKQTSILMHREVMNEINPLVEIDHIKGNGLDNQKSNLRKATTAQNQCNKKPRGTSKYLGVYWKKDRKKWYATIKKDYKLFRLGSFTKETDAALAYDEAAKKMHGEFANLNFKCK